MIKALLTFLLAICLTSIHAQDLKSKANESYQKENWKEAAIAYTTITTSNHKDSLAWYRLAICQLKLGQSDKALQSFDMALTTNFYPGYTLYSKAKVYAELNQPKEMYTTLSAAVERGFSNFGQLEKEEVWSAHRESEDFGIIFQRARENALPCLADTVRRHFDFWVGEWDVMVNGNKVGENDITLAEDGCLLQERYTTPGTFSGQSINYYNPLDQKWHQLWVANNGNVLDYTEVKKAEGMIQFIADFLNPAGVPTKSRLTFTANEDGTVRQLFENSSDGGKSWKPGFDGLYVRRTSD